MILKINERERWSNLPPTDPAKRALQDEEIFQIARNVKYVSLVPPRCSAALIQRLLLLYRNALNLKDSVPAVSKAWRNVDPDPRTRTFAGYVSSILSNL